MSGTAYYTCDNQNESIKALFKRSIAFEGGLPYLRTPSSFPFASDLVFDFDTRTGLNLVDNIAGELGEIGQFVCGDFVPASTPDIDLGDRNEFSFGDSVTDSPFWISAWINMRDASNFRIISKRGANPNTEWLFTTAATDELYLILYDGTAAVSRGRNTAALTALENTWIHVMATYNGVGGVNAQDGINLYVNNVVADIANVSAGVYTAMHNTNENVYIGYENRAVDYADGEMYDIRIGSGNLTAAQRLSIYQGGFVGTEIFVSPDVFSGIDISGNNFHGTVTDVIKGYVDGQDYLFTDGFTQYWDNATNLISLQIPYNVNGVAIGGATYTHDGTLYNRSELHPTNAFHNLAECFIDFNPTNSANAKFNIFNRSRAAEFLAAARVALPVGYYNAAEPWRFHISELSQLVLAGYYQVGQRRKTYTEGSVASIGPDDRDYLERIFVYATDKTGNNDIRVLRFTNDLTHVLVDAGGNYVFDVNNYAILAI